MSITDRLAGPNAALKEGGLPAGSAMTMQSLTTTF
eukprot:CAMPEP_0181429140 /NCGR_PEP_ID=MMETSP1110-20121109/17045_1 /TAXON_ID=174948 /ORGANISM="Symbiodinium sp., Strain CCMP421" /LENGTH=34 /DNA_ID= /DNA_START= /DNA_END= /DNA_ORIENTATION=